LFDAVYKQLPGAEMTDKTIQITLDSYFQLIQTGKMKIEVDGEWRNVETITPVMRRPEIKFKPSITINDIKNLIIQEKISFDLVVNEIPVKIQLGLSFNHHDLKEVIDELIEKLYFCINDE
jgi:hypothetical protein